MSNMAFAKRMKERREELRLTPAALAGMMTELQDESRPPVRVQTVRSWETYGHIPHPYAMRLLARALQTTRAWLLDERDNPEYGNRGREDTEALLPLRSPEEVLLHGGEPLYLDRGNGTEPGYWVLVDDIRKVLVSVARPPEAIESLDFSQVRLYAKKPDAKIHNKQKGDRKSVV